MRKYYLDNLRWIIILILFPYHTFLLYSPIGDYIINAGNYSFAGLFILIFSPWFMQLLFAIAGISTFYSLKKRNSTEYLKERVTKLLIPMASGVIFVISIQVYFAALYNGYTGGFLAFWWNFISNWPAYFMNGTGLGPMWFLLYLFIVSVFALPIIIKYKNSDWRIPIEKVTVPKLLLLFLPLGVGSLFLNLAPEKSLGQFFLLFIFGYFLLSEDVIQEKLEEKRWPLFISFIALVISFIVLGTMAVMGIISLDGLLGSPIFRLYENLLVWVAVLSILGMGKRYLEFKNSSTLYLSAASFPIYIFHIAWINMAAYYFIGFLPNMIILQIILIMATSFVMTIATYEIIRRIKIIRSLFGIRG
ncbi:acyltransferase family protein [Methanobacterium alcaliphilum]|uniref:acyltransferase family protein n=1 Tax=Methanobacterium alcaliphilum TaxID=392018 RepID=UPI00200AC156|nr:acyltransferase family protein [Methanobacterium alcaliphilum]MCK9151397.1 acyltransferase family protein [Methanobacterium alcaliphilum]